MSLLATTMQCGKLPRTSPFPKKTAFFMAMTDPLQALVSLQSEIRKGMPTHLAEKCP